MHFVPETMDYGKEKSFKRQNNTSTKSAEDTYLVSESKNNLYELLKGPLCKF